MQRENNLGECVCVFCVHEMCKESNMIDCNEVMNQKQARQCQIMRTAHNVNLHTSDDKSVEDHLWTQREQHKDMLQNRGLS